MVGIYFYYGPARGVFTGTLWVPVIIGKNEGRRVAMDIGNIGGRLYSNTLGILAIGGLIAL